MAKEPIEYERVGTIWRPKPKPRTNNNALWGWIALGVVALLLLAQCS